MKLSTKKKIIHGAALKQNNDVKVDCTWSQLGFSQVGTFFLSTWNLNFCYKSAGDVR